MQKKVSEKEGKGTVGWQCEEWDKLVRGYNKEREILGEEGKELGLNEQEIVRCQYHRE